MQLHLSPYVLPVTSAPVRDGGILVEGGRVVAFGPAASLRADASQTIEHAGILMPGLVNAHAHLQYGPSFADLLTLGRAFPDWLQQMNERRRLLDESAWAAEVAGSWALAQASGTVAVADVVTNVGALEVAVPGVRYLESVALPSEAWPDERTRLEAVLDVHGETGLSPHTLYTLGTDLLEGLNRLARTHGRRLHPHLAETQDEDDFVRRGIGPFASPTWPFAVELRASGGAGRSPAHYMDAIGGLGADVHVAHGTHLDVADRALLKERGTYVALCARSNGVLGAGIPPVAAHLAEGNPIAVGTDSLASTPDLDLLAEVRTLAGIARAQGYTGADLAARLLAAATYGGAEAIGRRDLGRIEPSATAAFAEVTVADPRAADLLEEILATGRARPVAGAGQADSSP